MRPRGRAGTMVCVVAPALVATTTAFAQRGAGRGAQPPGPRSVTIAAIPAVIAAGVAWTIAWQGPDNADGLVATPDGGVLFAQEQPNQVSKVDADDRVSVFLKNTRGAGSLTIDANGRLIAVERTCTDPGRRSADRCREPTTITVLAPERRVMADNIDGKPLGRLNDLVADRNGNIFFTVGGAYVLDARGRIASLGDDLRANGIMLSPDEQTLYVTNGRVIVAFDVKADGTTGRRRDFGVLEAGGAGDGMAVDAAGRLYVTSAPGVQVLAPDGSYLGLIPTPRSAISVAFSGPEKKTLYVVGSGALGRDGRELETPEGVRNNAKTIYRIATLARGFEGRAK